MNDHHPADLDDILLAYLKAVDAGQTPDQGDWLARYPQFAADLAVFFACERRLAGIGCVPTSGFGGETPTQLESEGAAPNGPAQAGRFQMGEVLGCGGIGSVVWAHDPVLDRPVAIKLLQHRHRGQPHVASRFLAEARIAAALQHPGVPAIHDIGELADGRPFIAMKLIAGRTLAEQLRQRSDPADDLPRFLKVFEQVAQTVAYAHSRGVLHRDLKPHNVMVGAFGEVQVMDWGMAKQLGTAGDGPGPDGPGRETLAVRGDDTDATQAGTVIGTPAYMAPEQARGEVERVDARADVFGLGAILCEILTGKPPFAGRTPLEQSRRAELTEAFERLDKSACDTGLIDLARRCLDPDPARRPADGQAVADAMTSHLVGVQERLRQAELTAARAAEAQKRRRVVQILSGLGLVLTLAGFGAVLWVQMRANAHLSQKADELAAANDRERQRFDLALDAIGLFHGELSRDLLLKEKQFAHLRSKLLRGAADFYDKLEAQAGDQDSPSAQATLARAYVKLGFLRRALGDLPGALAVARKALAINRRLAATPDADGGTRLAVARVLLDMSWWLGDAGDNTDVASTLAEARAIVERVEAEQGVSHASRFELSRILERHARFMLDRGDVEEARAGYEQVLAIIEPLAESRPDDREIRERLGQTHIQLGVTNRGVTASRRHYRKAQEYYQAWSKADPANLDWRSEVAHCQAALAGILDYAEVPLAESLADAETAVRLETELVAEYPTVSEFQRVLAMASSYAGRKYFLLNRTTEARAALEAARKIFQGLVEASPEVPVYRPQLARTLQLLAGLDLEAGNATAARQYYDRAIELLEEGLAKGPNDVGIARRAMNVRRLGLVELAAGRTAEATAATCRALDHLEPLSKKLDFAEVFRLEAAACHATLSGLAGQAGSGVPSADGPVHAARAMELLRFTSPDGLHAHPLLLTRDRGFDPLRGRPDYEALLREREEIVRRADQ